MILDEENGYDVEGDVSPEETSLEGLTDVEQTIKMIFGSIKPRCPEPLTKEEKALLIEKYGPTRVDKWWNPSNWPGADALREMLFLWDFSIEMRDLYEARWAKHVERRARHRDKRPFQRVIDRFGGTRQSPVHMRPIGPREWIKAQVMLVMMEDRQEGPYITTGFDSDEIKDIEVLTGAIMARFSNGDLNGIENHTERKIVERLQILGFGPKMPWLSVRENSRLNAHLEEALSPIAGQTGRYVSMAKGKLFHKMSKMSKTVYL